MSELITSNYSFESNSIKMTFARTITKVEYINITNSSRFLVGFENGSVISIDIADYISSATTLTKSVTNMT